MQVRNNVADLALFCAKIDRKLRSMPHKMSNVDEGMSAGGCEASAL
jgi:hypothetical protein